tara:strand:+ start:1233 stop:1430 length:198 start_codon:yes stop_codon:yes gene_type:complete
MNGLYKLRGGNFLDKILKAPERVEKSHEMDILREQGKKHAGICLLILLALQAFLLIIIFWLTDKR